MMQCWPDEYNEGMRGGASVSKTDESGSTPDRCAISVEYDSRKVWASAWEAFAREIYIDVMLKRSGFKQGKLEHWQRIQKK